MYAGTLKRIGLLACAASLAFAAPAFSKEEKSAIESFTLANGLEVIVIPNHRVAAVSHMVWYRVGAGDDPAGKSGLAHFHEHMMFQGTAKHKAGEYEDLIARHGGQQNAFTGHDATSYYINITKSELPLAMELEADRMRPLTPLAANAAKEKEVIIEERRQRIENNPDALLGEQVNAALFRNHPYHTPVIGWMHEMQQLTKDDVLKFHQTWYHPNNAMLIVSGDITAAELRPLAEKYYGSLPAVKVPERTWTEEPPQNVARQVVLHHPNVKQPEWSRTYSASSLASGKKDDTLPLFVLSQLMGGGKTSRLYQSIVVEQKLASEISVDYEGFNLGPGSFGIDATPEPGVTLEALGAAIDKEIARIAEGGFTIEEITRAKTLLKAESIYARDGLTSMARIMGWIRIAGLDKDYFTRWPDMIDAVTPEQINAALKATMVMEHSVTAYLLPQEKEAKK